MYIVSPNYALGDALAHLTRAFYRGAGNVPDGTKKSEQAGINRTIGLRSGIAAGIAELLTLESVMKFPLFDRIEKINDWDVEKILHDNQDEWELKRDDDNEAILVTIVDKLFMLVNGEEGKFVENHEALRHDGVRSGRIPVSPEDGSWIREEAESKQAEVKAIMDLLKPIEEEEESS